MKKILTFMTALSLFSYAASAETIVVVDANGNILQKTITTESYSPTKIVTTETYRSVPVINSTIIRETPVYNETYTYSNISTGNAILAGITTGIIGGLVYNGLKHHHKKAPIIHHKSNSHHGHNSGHKKHH